MPELMDEETRSKLVEALSVMRESVQLLLFADGSKDSQLQQQVLESVAALSDKVRLRVLHGKKLRDEAAEYGVDKFPATVPLGEKDYGIRFFGLTAGQEFTSLLQTILMISVGRSGLPADLEALVRTISKPVHMQVFVTLTCPYCPGMVHAAHQFAFVNDAIRADMVESSHFLEYARKYQVEGVPRTIINEATVLEGAHPPAVLYLTILRAVDPEEYRKVEAELLDRQGARHVVELEGSHVYDVLVLGGGPAAMSAALYAARKRMDVGLVAEKLGGQLTYTAQVENYLGFPGVSGNELVERFQFHMESYPVAELVGVRVDAVTKEGQGFAVRIADGRVFRAQAIVYCAGKEYTRLGVPGEERFLGHGIAFCATCDAPLYTDRSVAVVGGGNSALTAVRDLLSFAREVHVIHRRESFRADAALVEEVERHPRVRLHTPYEVSSFLGDGRLTGVEIRSADGQMETLEVDGVFLEIGLTPNTGPVKDIIPLNDRGEIPIDADHSTTLAGFFAAGDATSVPEKQISIAVGGGALAALTAYRYLVENRLVTPKAEVDDDWV